MITAHKKSPAIARFKSRVRVDSLTGCWLWTGRLGNHGYGQFDWQNKSWQAHRASYVLHRGEIPQGKYVLHGCDTPNCVNPEHLRLGDQFDNMADMWSRGRGRSGWDHAAQTHCKHGHSFTLENTLRDRRGNRRCRECSRQRCERKRRQMGIQPRAKTA